MGCGSCGGSGIYEKMPEVLSVMISPKDNYACVLGVGRESDRVRKSEFTINKYSDIREAEITFGSSGSNEQIINKVNRFSEVFSF